MLPPRENDNGDRTSQRLACEPLAGAVALGGGEHGVGERRIEGADAEVAGDDELAAGAAALQRLADRRMRARPAREVPLGPVVVVLVDVVDQEGIGRGDDLGLEVEVEVDRQQQRRASQPPAVEDRPWARDDRAGADLVLHGHAHRGSDRGLTPGGVRVRNVARTVIGAPYCVFELDGGSSTR